MDYLYEKYQYPKVVIAGDFNEDNNKVLKMAKRL